MYSLELTKSMSVLCLDAVNNKRISLLWNLVSETEWKGFSNIVHFTLISIEFSKAIHKTMINKCIYNIYSANSYSVIIRAWVEKADVFN